MPLWVLRAFLATELLLLKQEEGDFPLLLIGEPEANLHPQLQMKIPKFIRDVYSTQVKPKLQIILTNKTRKSLRAVINAAIIIPAATRVSHPDCREFGRRMILGKKKIYCAFGVDIDSVAGWIGSYGGGDSPSDIQRGIFAAEVGLPRLLQLFRKYELRTSFFVPGHSLETFPKQMKMIVDEGHEIGAHGYLHENPKAMTSQQEEDVLVKSIELIDKLTGKEPRGYVAPWWEMSAVTTALLKKYGFSYDHSQGYRDFQPFYARTGDKWNVIDYTKKAGDWMHPLKHGNEIDLVDIGANWYLDDLPPMMFMKTAPNSHGFVNPRDIEELWRDQFDWVYREMDYAVFALTIHPDVSGRPQVLLMLERLIEYISGHEGVEWATFEDIADDFRKRYPFSSDRRPEVI